MNCNRFLLYKVIHNKNRTYCRNSLELNIEGLSSLNRLHLSANTSEVHFSTKNLPSLTYLTLSISATINEDIITRLFEKFPHIEELALYGKFSFFNLDKFVNLRKLSLFGSIEENFNFELLKYLRNQLENIEIIFINIDEKTFDNLFDGYNFPYLVDISVKYFNIKRLKKELLNGFPALRRLIMTNCEIEVIEHDSFSNCEQLCMLDLSVNRIFSIGKNAFSKLENLQKLDLSYNELNNFDPKFVGLIETAKYII